MCWQRPIRGRQQRAARSAASRLHAGLWLRRECGNRGRFEGRGNGGGREVGDVRVDRRGLEMGVPQQRLDSAKVTAALEEMGSEGMTQRVWADSFSKPRADRGIPNGPLDDGRIEMPTAAKARAGVVDESRPGEEVLPTEVGGGRWRLTGKGIRERYMAKPAQHVFLVQRAKTQQVGFEWRLEAGRNDCEPVPLALSIDDDDRVVIEVEVLDAEVQALRKAKAGAVEHLADEAKRALEAAEESQRFTLAEDGRNVPRAPGTTELKRGWQVDRQDLSEEAQDGCKRLALCAGRDVFYRGEVRKKRLDLDLAECGRGATGMEPEESADPMRVCIDSAWGATQEGKPLAENGEEVG